MSEMPILSDPALPAVQRIADLAKNSSAPGKLVLVEDEEPLLNAIHAGLKFVGCYAVADTAVPESVLRAGQSKGLAVERIAAPLAKDLFRTDKFPKLFGVAQTPKPVKSGTLIDAAKDLLILDGVRIVGNIGAIARSAFAFGMSGMILIDSGLQSIADRRLIRASRGYVFSLPVTLMNWEEVESVLEAADLPSVALATDGDQELGRLATYRRRLAFVLGSETTGVSPQGLEACQKQIAIPMNPAVESLNVSVSAAILMHARSNRNLRLRG